MSSRDEVKTMLRAGGLVPVIRVQTREQALAVATVLVESDIRTLEVTLTVPGALRCIEAIADQYGAEVLLGAGTVLDAESCRAALLAGARFIVSPSLSRATISMALRYSALAIPGALTPTEVLTAWECGADFVKVFPCDAMGGPRYLKALKAPLPQVDLIPTGGVTLASAEAFLQAGAAALGVGSDLVSARACGAGDWDAIRERGRGFVEIVRRFRQAQRVSVAR